MICPCLTWRYLSDIYGSAFIDNIFSFWIFHYSVRWCVHLPLFPYLSNIIVQRVQRTKLDSESFVNVYQFIRYLSFVFKKNSSVKDLIYLFCLSKCFGKSIMWQVKNVHQYEGCRKKKFLKAEIHCHFDMIILKQLY